MAGPVSGDPLRILRTCRAATSRYLERCGWARLEVPRLASLR
ncbi:hypothetical protein KZZ52_02370 [Dactylosporangium sp. AC04546]|nr:hypothetical protein [Dactylosporangium sp. AC04546]WVK84301.1 hypothetical protein KZZ52_02370 [Dactylosporangium sp. AC04546]